MENTNFLLEQLREIVGERNVITAEDSLEPYSHDETAGLKHLPLAAVKPADTAEVSAVMKFAYANNLSVTPRGAGTGLSGGAVATQGGIVLSLERLNKILEIDTENLMVVTQPGVITDALQKAVEEKGLFYPPDPGSLESCHIGGNVAENAGGPRAFKYGVTKKYLCGMEVVWPDGRVSRLGGKLIKNVAGYDMGALICGSEGTLAIVTEVTLNLIPKPAAQADLLIPFPSIGQAVTAVTEIIQRQRIMPAAMEFMEKRTVQMGEKFLQKDANFREAAAQLIIQLDGDTMEHLQEQYEKIGEIVMEHGAEDVLVAEDKTSRDRLWELRRCLSEALTAYSPMLKKDDIVVPRAKIPQMFAELADLQKKYGLEIVCYGHIGDGNIHATVLKCDSPDELWTKNYHPLLADMYARVAALGGSVTGEHGVGSEKRCYLSTCIDPAAMEMMKAVKKAVDPKGLLNPAKIFPD